MLKDLTCSIYNKLQLNSRKTIQLNIGKRLKHLLHHFIKEDVLIANKYIKRFLTSLIIRKMQFKTKIRYHYTSIRMAKMKKTVRSNVGKDSEQLNI